ncbi:sensor of ECF-type sigma factor [Flavivirga spongiicola]|uniref:Sensor of ECF-type sigma factor n=1 Tax=Flavivirga spongiicola TaxID=421621 RepID=A0ABU7XPN1_9FLAO|nr:sensor of ECF-type sigma factor [Flavivirga sp. MEBiC05379]MDO5977735.1 sensor of ECF-type sigma factor [Flavivirga sp. MEBiC05379]
MKKIIFPILLFFFSLNILAQQNREKIKTLKISFITEKLDLTEQEAQKFWPIYNNYYNVTSKIRHEDIRSIRHEIRRNINTLTDKRAKDLITKLNKAESTLHEQRMELSTKLLKIIPPKKVILLKMAEDDFKRKMLERFKNKGYQKRGGK